MAKLNKNVIKALQDIQATGRVSADVGKPLLEQGLIEVNTADVVDDKAAARLTQKAFDSLPKQSASAAPSGGGFALMTGLQLPESKRGTGRAAGPSKYPFDSMEAGQSFFVPVSEEVPNPLKTLGSAVSNATNKYAVDTGKTETKERTKRGEGNKAVIDAAGNKVKETVTVPVYDYPRKFTIRGIKQGQVIKGAAGDWTAPSDGALIARVR